LKNASRNWVSSLGSSRSRCRFFLAKKPNRLVQTAQQLSTKAIVMKELKATRSAWTICSNIGVEQLACR
jgi:hypothetical protein